MEKNSESQLRNGQTALPLKKGSKVYFEDYAKNYHNVAPGAGALYNKPYGDISFVTKPEEADVILLWIKPSMRPLFPADDSPLRVNLSACAIDVKYINSLTAKKPTVLVINYANPFAIDEIYNDQTRGRFRAVLATFGIEPEALLDVISGKFIPAGKMPFTTPISQQAVETNKEDVPGYLEGDAYALFRFDEGLSY